MADEDQLYILRKGIEVWNNWRKENPTLKIDLCEAELRDLRLRGVNLSEANLKGADLVRTVLVDANLKYANLENSHCAQASFTQADLSGVNLSNATLENTSFWKADVSRGNLQGARLKHAGLGHCNLTAADLRGANLTNANLMNANLQDADLSNAMLVEAYLYEAQLIRCKLIGTDSYRANFESANLLETDLTNADFTSASLSRANLKGADLTNAFMCGVNFFSTDLTEANLTSANLQNASLVETILENTILSNCKVYGISAWNVKGIPKEQSSLIITPDGEIEITVDDLQVAQFIYLLLKRENLRNIIDTITSKAILILGRFTTERKVILEAIADELRKYNLLPIIFDFERSPSRDFTETIKILAGMSLFIIADITNPKSAPLELQATVPDYQVPFIPIIQDGEKPFAMFSDLIGKYDWVLDPVITYQSKEHLLKGFKAGILDRGWEKHKELQAKKTAIIRTQSIDDFVSKTS